MRLERDGFDLKITDDPIEYCDICWSYPEKSVIVIYGEEEVQKIYKKCVTKMYDAFNDILKK